MTNEQLDRAVNNRVQQALGGTVFSAVPIVDADLSEPIKRPSIKILLEDGTLGRFNGCCVEESVTVHIYFFAADRYRPKPENTAMQQLLSAAFLDDLAVDSVATIPIEQVESTISDGVLVCSLDLQCISLLPDNDHSPAMESLNLIERVN